MKNIAYIDGQNLHLSITKCNMCAERKNIDYKQMKFSDCDCGKAWKIDFSKFRTYLRDQYKIDEAYYFLGYIDEDNQSLYSQLQKAGFIVQFKNHKKEFKGDKKGNVDTDIVFEIMQNICEEREENKFLLVSGDGDYYKLIKYLFEKKRLVGILFPSSNYSSLYFKFDNKFTLNLERVKNKIQLAQ